MSRGKEIFKGFLTGAGTVAALIAAGAIAEEEAKKAAGKERLFKKMRELDLDLYERMALNELETKEVLGESVSDRTVIRITETETSNKEESERMIILKQITSLQDRLVRENDFWKRSHMEEQIKECKKLLERL